MVGAQTVKILTVSHESAQDTQDDNVPNRQTYQTYIDITQQAQTRVRATPGACACSQAARQRVSSNCTDRYIRIFNCSLE